MKHAMAKLSSLLQYQLFLSQCQKLGIIEKFFLFLLKAKRNEMFGMLRRVFVSLLSAAKPNPLRSFDNDEFQ